MIRSRRRTRKGQTRCAYADDDGRSMRGMTSVPSVGAFIRLAVGALALSVLPMADLAVAQDRPGPAAEVAAGWVGFADDGSCERRPRRRCSSLVSASSNQRRTRSRLHSRRQSQSPDRDGQCDIRRPRSNERPCHAKSRHSSSWVPAYFRRASHSSPGPSRQRRARSLVEAA